MDPLIQPQLETRSVSHDEIVPNVLLVDMVPAQRCDHTARLIQTTTNLEQCLGLEQPRTKETRNLRDNYSISKTSKIE
jgi:hypothetical protein